MLHQHSNIYINIFTWFGAVFHFEIWKVLPERILYLHKSTERENERNWIFVRSFYFFFSLLFHWIVNNMNLGLLYWKQLFSISKTSFSQYSVHMYDVFKKTTKFLCKYWIFAPTSTYHLFFCLHTFFEYIAHRTVHLCVRIEKK